MAVYIVQALINMFIIFLIYRLALKIFDKKVALIALCWAGLYIFYVRFAACILRETMIYLFFIGFFNLFYSWLTNNRDNKKNTFFASLVFFLLVHADMRYLYLFPCIFVLFVFYHRIRRGLKNFFIFVLIVITLSIPWGIRNYRTYGSFVLISTFYFPPGATLMESKFRYLINLHPSIKSQDASYPTDEERQIIKQGLNPKNRSQSEIDAIKKDVFPVSTFWGRRLFWLKELWQPMRLVGTYHPFPSCKFFPSYSFTYNLTSMICYGFILPFAFIGTIILLSKRKKYVLFLLLPIFCHTLAHVAVASVIRYRIPIDSFLIILGAYGIRASSEFLITIKKRRA